MRARRLAVVLLMLGVAGCGEAEAPRDVTVFAAASLTDALEAVADSFEAAHPGYRVVLNVAATSLLARQIEQGAPADVFFAANRDWMDRLAEGGHLEGAVYEPFGNRLVVVGRAGQAPLVGLDDLGQQRRIALADPEHVPAGLYARAGLECAGLWTELQPRLVPMLDVRAALLAVRNGATDVALVYASDVPVEPSVEVLLDWPAACHPEIRYTAARVRHAPAPEAAAAFLAFATAPARDATWQRFGFAARGQESGDGS